jgi:hypothetical protein
MDHVQQKVLADLFDKVTGFTASLENVWAGPSVQVRWALLKEEREGTQVPGLCLVRIQHFNWGQVGFTLVFIS